MTFKKCEKQLDYAFMLLALLCLLLNPQIGSYADPAPKTRVVILGDSLTEGFGVEKKHAYPTLVEKKLHANGHPNVEIVNAGISGSTTASGLSRLQWLLNSKVDVLVLALGANDGLRGMSVINTEKNLREIIELALRNKAKVILAGMEMPKNYGEKYRKDFSSIFKRLGKHFPNITVVPFLLEGVAADPAMNQADGIHPNEKGHQKISETIYRSLLTVL